MDNFTPLSLVGAITGLIGGMAGLATLIHHIIINRPRLAITTAKVYYYQGTRMPKPGQFLTEKVAETTNLINIELNITNIRRRKNSVCSISCIADFPLEIVSPKIYDYGIVYGTNVDLPSTVFGQIPNFHKEPYSPDDPEWKWKRPLLLDEGEPKTIIINYETGEKYLTRQGKFRLTITAIDAFGKIYQKRVSMINMLELINQYESKFTPPPTDSAL